MGKYEVGDIVKCYVTGIEKYGIFVNLDEYYSGLIHISEISDDFVRNVGDFVSVGETIKAKVVDVIEDEFHLKLSIKNVDYQILKKRKLKIVETDLGFSTLEKFLPIWMEEKLLEIEKK